MRVKFETVYYHPAFDEIFIGYPTESYFQIFYRWFEQKGMRCDLLKTIHVPTEDLVKIGRL